VPDRPAGRAGVRGLNRQSGAERGEANAVRGYGELCLYAETDVVDLDNGSTRLAGVRLENSREEMMYETGDAAAVCASLYRARRNVELCDAWISKTQPAHFPWRFCLTRRVLDNANWRRVSTIALSRETALRGDGSRCAIGVRLRTVVGLAGAAKLYVEAIHLCQQSTSNMKP
jgi:hypothetical protein